MKTYALYDPDGVLRAREPQPGAPSVEMRQLCDELGGRITDWDTGVIVYPEEG